MAHAGFKYTIELWNPYIEHPDGKPRIKAEMYETIQQRSYRISQGGPPIPEWFSSMKIPGDGYALTIKAISTPSKMLPTETLAKVRTKRLIRRMNNKFPLFADQFIQQELNKKPKYYSGETDTELLEAHQSAINQEAAEWDKFLKYIGKH